MEPGDVVLIELPQVGGGNHKIRPALVVAKLPGVYQNLLICGINTQFRDLQQHWDELIETTSADFASSGLRRASAIRPSCVYSADASEIFGAIGRIDLDRLDRVPQHLVQALS
jgi:mRNA interferase MazF